MSWRHNGYDSNHWMAGCLTIFFVAVYAFFRELIGGMFRDID